MKKDWWDKSKVIISGFTAAGVLVGVYVGSLINKAISENDLKVRMLNVSLDILHTTPNKHPEDIGREKFDMELRKWALGIFRDTNRDLGIIVSPYLLEELQTRPLYGTANGVDWTDIGGQKLWSKQSISAGAIQPERRK